jgi:hypothetical protein
VQRVQSDSRTQPVSCSICTGARPTTVKRPAREPDHSNPCSKEINNWWIYTSTPTCAFMSCASPFTLRTSELVNLQRRLQHAIYDHHVRRNSVPKIKVCSSTDS